MKKKIYTLVMAMSALLAATFTSCDSDANILQIDETVGVYAGDVQIGWYALEDNLEFEGKTYFRGDTIGIFNYEMAKGDTCFVGMNINNKGLSNLMVVVPGDEQYGITSQYFLNIDGIPVSELGNRVASVGVRELSFGTNKFNTSTLYQPYNGADFDYVDENNNTQQDHVSGEVAFICGNYQLVMQTTMVDDDANDLKGIGIVLDFNGWLLSGQDSNDLIKRRNKR